MLRKLTPRHRDIARRLVLGQPVNEIALELGMNAASISALQRDPSFRSEVLDFERSLREKILGGAVMERLQSLAPRAAEVCISVLEGRLDGEDVPLRFRLDSAWDILDRTGFGKVTKSVSLSLTPAELIIMARNRPKSPSSPDDGAPMEGEASRDSEGEPKGRLPSPDSDSPDSIQSASSSVVIDVESVESVVVDVDDVATADDGNQGGSCSP